MSFKSIPIMFTANINLVFSGSTEIVVGRGLKDVSLVLLQLIICKLTV